MVNMFLIEYNWVVGRAIFGIVLINVLCFVLFSSRGL